MLDECFVCCQVLFCYQLYIFVAGADALYNQRRECVSNVDVDISNTSSPRLS